MLQGDLFPEDIPDPGENDPSSEEKAERINKQWAQMTGRERLYLFLGYHRVHPQVYWGIVQVSRVMKRRGMKQWGMKAAFEVLRFQWVLQYNRADFKVNNNFAPYYARLVMQQELDLNNFYEVRALERPTDVEGFTQ